MAGPFISLSFSLSLSLILSLSLSYSLSLLFLLFLSVFFLSFLLSTLWSISLLIRRQEAANIVFGLQRMDSPWAELSLDTRRAVLRAIFFSLPVRLVAPAPSPPYRWALLLRLYGRDLIRTPPWLCFPLIQRELPPNAYTQTRPLCIL
jgi:hypothetical protein